MKAPPLPDHVDSFDDIPASARVLYESSSTRDGYDLRPPARHLAKLRREMASNPVFSGFPRPKTPPVISLADWTALLGAATPKERKLLLGGVVGGVYKVSR